MAHWLWSVSARMETKKLQAVLAAVIGAGSRADNGMWKSMSLTQSQKLSRMRTFHSGRRKAS